MSSLSSGANREDMRTAADSQLEEEAIYINNLETQMQNVVKHSAMLIKRNREVRSFVNTNEKKKTLVFKISVTDCKCSI